jgi:hypothetical protein
VLYLVKTENSSEDAAFTNLNATYIYIISKEFVKLIIEIGFDDTTNGFVNKEYTIEQFKKLILLT